MPDAWRRPNNFMSGSSIDLSERAELGQLAEVVGELRHAAPDYEPLLVGAMARDLLLSYAYPGNGSARPPA